jgi:hypothetical protein
MKSKFLALICVLGIGGSAVTPSAQAGLVVTAAGGGVGVLYVGALTTSLGASLLVGYHGRCISGYYSGPIFICTRYVPGRPADPSLSPLAHSLIGVGLSLVILDAKGEGNPSVRTSQITQMLKERYRGVDNNEALINLAVLINEETSKLVLEEQSVIELKLGEEKVRNAFSSADISESDLQSIVSDLN